MWFKEALVDVSTGNGVSSSQKTFNEKSSSEKIVKFYCPNCHYLNEYNVNSENICPSCMGNPSFCNPNESPFDKFGIASDPKPNVVQFQEPLCYNPVGANLLDICDELGDKMPPGDKIQCIISDALINVGLLRIKRKVYCSSHDELFALWEEDKVNEHSTSECRLQNPLENVIAFDGQSHELMTMILNYMRFV